MKIISIHPFICPGVEAFPEQAQAKIKILRRQ